MLSSLEVNFESLITVKSILNTYLFYVNDMLVFDTVSISNVSNAIVLQEMSCKHRNLFAFCFALLFSDSDSHSYLI